jgi:hypothetical protein
MGRDGTEKDEKGRNMSENSPNLHPETLAKFDALERVRDLRRFLPHGGVRVDSSGLLAMEPPTPLGEPAIADGPQPTPKTTDHPRARPDTRMLKAHPRWHRNPSVIYALGVACVLATGLLTYLIILLAN